jgi:hypothetical protein
MMQLLHVQSQEEYNTLCDLLISKSTIIYL